MLKNRKINRIFQVEMSPETIDRRLLDLAQLYKLGISIQSAHRLGKVNEIRAAEGLENQNKCGNELMVNIGKKQREFER